MRFVTAYISYLREAYLDVVDAFESSEARGFVLAALVMIPIFGTFFFVTILAQAAERFMPSAVIAIEQVATNTVAVTLSNNTAPLNAAEIDVRFDATALTVTDMMIADAVCDEQFVITSVIDNEAGRVFYQCGTLTPFVGTSTTLAWLTVAPKTAASTTLEFATSTSNVLAHDGLGTNVTKDHIGHTLANSL